MNRRPIRSTAALAALLTVAAFAPTPARAAALTLVFEPALAGQSVVPAGTNVAINVVLRGPRAARIIAAQFDVGQPTNGATIGANAAAADRFDESAVLGMLDQVVDGSLVDNRTIALGTNSGTGIVAGTNDVRIGTFYLQTPAGVAGSYGVTPQNIELSDPSFAVLPTTGLGTTITTVVPEPATLAAAAGMASLLFTRRRRHR